MNDLFSLNGKTIVITGGAGYLGRAMSEALLRYGADLFILGHDAEKNAKWVEELNRKYHPCLCESIVFDISNETSIANAFQEVTSKTGKLDVLINNAAYYSDEANFEKYDRDEWAKGIDGTINATFRVTQAAIRYMLQQGAGNIINIASMYGMVSPNMDIYGDSGQNNPANYGAGKAAVIQLTKYLACVYGEKGIRVNAVSPGPFPNKNTQKMDWFIRNLENKVPVKRIGQPEDLMGIIVFLSSDSSGYINGQNIAVDGGWTAW